MLQYIQLPLLAARVTADSESFRYAKPFRHVVLDDLLVLESARELLNAFPAVEWPGWDRGFGDNEPHQPKKLTCWDIGVIPSPLDLFIHELNSGPFLTWLEKLTGIEDLIPDPQLAGGGLHSSGPGGRLVPHTDFHKGKNQRLYRRLNLLVYFNENWSADNNGALELWDLRKDRIERQVLPEFGKAVIFETDDQSMHGFSKPIVGRFRNSVAIYYYTAYPTSRYSGDGDTHWRPDGGPKRGLITLPVRKLAMFASRAMAGAGWRLANAANRVEDWTGGRQAPP